MEVTSSSTKFSSARTPCSTELFTVMMYSHSTQSDGAALGCNEGSTLRLGDSLGSLDDDGSGVLVGSSEGSELGEEEGDEEGERLGLLEGEELGESDGDEEGEPTQMPQKLIDTSPILDGRL
jgi:hypothetical protein